MLSGSGLWMLLSSPPGKTRRMWWGLIQEKTRNRKTNSPNQYDTSVSGWLQQTPDAELRRTFCGDINAPDHGVRTIRAHILSLLFLPLPNLFVQSRQITSLKQSCFDPGEEDPPSVSHFN